MEDREHKNLIEATQRFLGEDDAETKSETPTKEEQKQLTETVSISIETDNDAFVDDRNAELARILHDLADKIEAGNDVSVIRDMNGNTVGEISY